MPLAPLPGTGDETAAFTVGALSCDDGLLVVQGRWSGVRGMRFLRPTLVVGGRQVLATLDHKPWAPDDSRVWTAAFPWTGSPDDLDDAWLEVAPSIVVPLGQAAAAAPVEPRTPPQPGDGILVAQRRADEEAMAARQAQGERDRALEIRDEAVRDREAALRTRDRLARSHEQAVAAAAAAERRRDEGIAEARRGRDDAVRHAIVERDDARGQVRRTVEERDALRSQREDIMLAHHALEQTLRRERAEADRRAAEPAAETSPPAVPAADDIDDDIDDGVDIEVPIGVRAIPAAQVVGAISLAPRTPERAALGTFDRWALRVLAIAAASCFILLLLLLARVFI